MMNLNNLAVVQSGVACAPTNQGVAIRCAPLMWNGLRFATESERQVAKALDDAGVFFAPLPLIRATGESGVRVTQEIDFLIIQDGIAGVLQLDGFPHNGRAADDHRRDRALKRAGLWVIERVNSVEALRDPQSIVRHFRGMIRHYRRTA